MNPAMLGLSQASQGMTQVVPALNATAGVLTSTTPLVKETSGLLSASGPIIRDILGANERVFGMVHRSFASGITLLLGRRAPREAGDRFGDGTLPWIVGGAVVGSAGLLAYGLVAAVTKAADAVDRSLPPTPGQIIKDVKDAVRNTEKDVTTLIDEIQNGAANTRARLEDDLATLVRRVTK